MAEAQTSPYAVPRPRSILPRLLALAGVMLVVAAVLNWKDIRAIATHRRTFTSVVYGRNPNRAKATFSFPAPLGPQDAKVKVWVVCQEGNSCHQPLVGIWAGIATLEPKRLRVEFYSPWEVPKTEGKPLELGCDSGVAINGQTKFVLGSGKTKRTLYLTGPMPSAPPQTAGGEPVSGHGPSGHGWTVEDLAAVVNQALEKAYKQKGTLTVQAIQNARTEAEKTLPKPTEDLLKGGPAHGSGHAMPPTKAEK